jgi:sugar phosphate isomerase/epimerase
MTRITQHPAADAGSISEAPTMSTRDSQRDRTRRQFLAAGCAAVGAAALGGAARSEGQAPGDRDGSYGPFKMGLQSYSLRGLGEGGRPDVQRALKATGDLGVHYWEAYPDHIPITTEPVPIAEWKRQLASSGVTLIGYGVVHLGQDAAADRKVFEFARAMGLKYLSASPAPGSFDALDKLVEEFGVAVGIHNHGPGDRYARIETIEKAIKDHHPKIGCCVDTGHFLRSREDPVHAVEAFGRRVYGVHLKDVKDADTFTILGRGDLRTVDLLKALARNNYDYCLAIEYEEKPENPLDDIKTCLAEARKAIAEAKKA